MYDHLLSRVRREAGLILQIGGPVIAAQLATMSMGFVDTVMAGNLNARALAAVAIGYSLLNPVIVLSIGILMALNPITAHLFGARKFPTIGKNVRQALWLSQILGLVSFLAVRNLRPVMILIHVDPAVVPLASGYLDAVSWGIPGITAYLALRFFNDAIGTTKPGMYVAILGLVVNIIGNYIFMYGKLGFPAMGAIGTGWSSALVCWVEMAAIFIYTIRRRSYRRFDIFHHLHLPEWKYIREMLRIGVPNGVSSFMEVSMFALVTLIMGSLGTTVVAGHQIALNFCSLTFMLPFGLSTAITVRVGHAIGRKTPHDARFSGYTGVFICTCIMCGTAFIMLVFPQWIAAIYTDNTAVSSIAISLLHIAAIFQISDGLQVSGLGALRGLKDTAVPMIVNIVAYWGIGIPVGYYFGIIRHAGPEGLWFGLIAGLTAAALLHNSRFFVLTRRMLRSNSNPAGIAGGTMA